MYEGTKREIDWKGLFLKVIIVFLVVIIGFKAYSTLKGNNKVESTKTETIAKTKTSSTFTANIDALKKAGESYFKKNTNAVPTSEGSSKMVTLNELISAGEIKALTDEDGKSCDGESSYVNATLENNRVKIKANLVCGTASSYSLVYMDSIVAETTPVETKSETVVSDNKVSSTKTTTTSNNNGTTRSTTTTTTNAQPVVKVSTETNVNQEVKINTDTAAPAKAVVTTTPNNAVYTADKVTVYFDSNGGNISYPSVRVNIGSTVNNPGETYKNGYRFVGWFLNGYRYDFSAPVNQNITLVAGYVDDNSYNYNYNYNYNNVDPYSYVNTGYSVYNTSREETSNVYSAAWKKYGTASLQVSHTLRVPTPTLSNYSKVRIKSIIFVQPLNTEALANAYVNNFNSTFHYQKTGAEIYTTNPNFYATVYNAYFSYDNSYKTRSEAINNGFSVTWSSTNISRHCSMPYSGTLGNGNSISNVCGYGINYKVVWEFIY